MDALNTNISFVLSRLHADEHVGAHQKMLNMMKTDVETVSEVQSELTEYENVVERVVLIFRHGPKSPETKYIAKLDVQRDKLWRKGKQLLKLYIDNSDPAIQMAADKLLILLEHYGNVPISTLFGETTSIEQTIDDFSEPENQAKVALIPGLSVLIDELESVNTELGELYFQRLQELEAIKQLGKLADYFPAADKLLIALFRALNTVYDYNERTAKNATVKATIERIGVNAEALFDQLRKVIEHRRKKAGGGTQKPDITNPEIPGTDTPDPENPGDGGDENGDGGDEGDGGETPGGDTHNPDVTNPPIPPFIPDFE